MTVWEVLHTLVDWDNDDDRGIITRVDNGIFATYERAVKEFEKMKKSIYIGDPVDYIEQTIEDTYIYLEENYRVELLVVIEQEVEA